jgi:hypothetical protein
MLNEQALNYYLVSHIDLYLAKKVSGHLDMSMTIAEANQITINQ